ncbi:Nicotinamide riboside kinase 1, partial [Zootermopsis nevadensis]
MWLIIGVSGATCSGKSILATSLQKELPGSSLICQDDFFLPVDSELHTTIPALNHINWEIISSLDMERMHAVTENLLVSGIKITNGCDDKQTSGVSILIIEGFLIFNDKKLADLCHRKYFLTLTKEQCWARRHIRTYDPPDVPGYFDQCVWPEYEKHRDQVFKEVPNVILIDGNRDKTSIMRQVLLETVQ